MSIVFQTQYGELHCGDSDKVLMDYKKNEFGLCLTDPPYGIKENNDKNLSRSKPFGCKDKRRHDNKTNYTVTAKNYGHFIWDKERIKKPHIRLIQYLSKNQIIFGGNYYADMLKPSSCWIVWDKNNSGDFADCELAWTSFKTAVRIFKYTWNGMLQHDMKNKEKRFHPTQKPLRLFEWIIENYYKDGVVLDPFAGSGTTAIVCERLKIPWICIEKESRYCEIIVNRLSELQQMLF